MIRSMCCRHWPSNGYSAKQLPGRLLHKTEPLVGRLSTAVGARRDAAPPGCERAGSASEPDPGSHRGGAPTQVEPLAEHLRLPPTVGAPAPGCEGFRKPLLFLKPRKPQISPGNPIPPDNGNPPRYRQIGSKGQGGGIGITTALENDDAQHGTHQRRQKNGQRQHLPATPSPEHGQQLEVAITHAFLAGDQLEYP